VTWDTALPARGLSSATTLRTLVSAIDDRVIAAVVNAITSLGCARMNGGVAIIAVLTRDVAIAVLVSFA
jgi:hypothetical protein